MTQENQLCRELVQQPLLVVHSLQVNCHVTRITARVLLKDNWKPLHSYSSSNNVTSLVTLSKYYSLILVRSVDRYSATLDPDPAQSFDSQMINDGV